HPQIEDIGRLTCFRGNLCPPERTVPSSMAPAVGRRDRSCGVESPFARNSTAYMVLPLEILDITIAGNFPITPSGDRVPGQVDYLVRSFSRSVLTLCKSSSTSSSARSSLDKAEK